MKPVPCAKRRGNPSHTTLPMKAELVEQAALVITDPPILINLVSKRVRQLQAGRPALVERRPGLRDADIALTEIIQGKIRVADPLVDEDDL